MSSDFKYVFVPSPFLSGQSPGWPKTVPGGINRDDIIVRNGMTNEKLSFTTGVL